MIRVKTISSDKRYIAVLDWDDRYAIEGHCFLRVRNLSTGKQETYELVHNSGDSQNSERGLLERLMGFFHRRRVPRILEIDGKPTSIIPRFYDDNSLVVHLQYEPGRNQSLPIDLP